MGESLAHGHALESKPIPRFQINRNNQSPINNRRTAAQPRRFPHLKFCKSVARENSPNALANSTPAVRQKENSPRRAAPFAHLGGVTRSVAHLNARPVPMVAIPHWAASRPVAAWNIHRGRCRGYVIDPWARCRNPEQRPRSESSNEPRREIVARCCRLCRDARQR
jgi:hypothetical protein